MQAVLGLSVFIVIAWIFSENRKAVSWIFSMKALSLQFVLAVVFLKIPFATHIFSFLSRGVMLLQTVTDRASQFLFGYLSGGAAPYDITHSENNFIVVFRVLPLILVVSALSAVLFHWRVIPIIVQAFGVVLRKILGLSGILGLGSASTLFFGTIEAPLLVRPYLSSMNRSDLFALITCSMSTVSGTVMILYSGVLSKILPNAFTHLLVASIMSVPAALLISKIMIPSKALKTPLDGGDTQIRSPYEGTLDALMRGISEGMNMIFGIIGVILVFFALLYLLNEGLLLIHPDLTVESILGTILRPIMWLTGISWSDTLISGRLMGTKIVLNEFVAYLELSQSTQFLNKKSLLILTYSLCGFANIGSMGIIVGGLSSILPERKKELMELTVRSLIAGNLATLMTGTIVGLLS